MSLGPYWIDPNGGCERDAIEVWCDYSDSLCQSCVDPVKKVSQCVCVCGRHCICYHGNQIPVGMKTRDIAKDDYYLATSLENAKPVSNYLFIYWVDVDMICHK